MANTSKGQRPDRIRIILRGLRLSTLEKIAPVLQQRWGISRRTWASYVRDVVEKITTASEAEAVGLKVSRAEIEQLVRQRLAREASERTREAELAVYRRRFPSDPPSPSPMEGPQVLETPSASLSREEKKPDTENHVDDRKSILERSRALPDDPTDDTSKLT